MRTSVQVHDPVFPDDRDHHAVAEHLDRWERASLLSHEEAEAIRGFELREAPTTPPRRIPLVAELIGYVGVALVLAAIVVLVTRFFDDMPWGVQIVLTGAGAMLFLAAGLPIHRRTEPALDRLAAVLWSVSVVGVGLCMGVVLFGQPNAGDPASWALLVFGLVTAAYAATLLGIHTSSLLQAATFAAVTTTLVGLGSYLVDLGWNWLDEQATWVGFATGLGLSVLWIAGGRAEIVRPRMTAYGLGAFGVACAPMFLLGEDTGAAVLVGAVVSAALLGAAVSLRAVPALVFGALGLFGYLTGCAVHFLQDSAGLPIVLLLSGFALVGVALLTVRLGRITAAPPDERREG